ncbi:putative acid phosphatase [Fulvia fulva]|uniref:3-phytase n=1 Tax=Passalora fulva TaxID=5499 RepID=A0A9Q8LC99_PASFU|nr:putative acid phosphatase [Fulvia fulva]KAK4632932.1 putative acid phosphatase [Fulvia fulva]UJO14108.1 putative acid phosphatase [Fulvia fulva]WPV11630.1 putative acid phosphatase [Fulvia fulva]
MTTLQPRRPYSEEELKQLYPKGLELQQVQILLRHGERTPVSARFKNAGLHGTWPYCKAANELKSAILTADRTFDNLQWKRRLETFGERDLPKLAAGPKGEIDAICQPGELTDRGRETTLALGQRIRQLYVDQLGFLPASLDEGTRESVSLRATPIQRALESVQQAYSGLYPAASRAPGLAPPAIVQRLMQDETLFPNEGACKRFAELSHAFADRTAKLWNDSPEMQHINKRIGKWMPKESPVVKVDSHPRLSGVMDSVNATLAHGSATKLPTEFYEEQVRANIDRICVEEWFVGYQESNEYRKLGIGGLVGDLTQRMVEHVNGIPKEGEREPFKMALSGCHDTTIASTLAALGGFEIDKDKWPNFTSNIAFELFKPKQAADGKATTWPSKEKSWWYSLFGSPKSSTSSAREPLSSLPESSKQQLDQHYVRLRYNDKPVVLPFCKPVGRHLEGDESFCTLAAFKEAADMITPKDWKSECRSNLGTSAFPDVISPPPGASPRS